MFTIEFNTVEKVKLLEILNKDGSREALEFVNRINSCPGFYSPTDNHIFKIYGEMIPREYELIDNGHLPSGMKWKSAF